VRPLPEPVHGAVMRRLRKFAPSGLLLLATLAFILADAARWGFATLCLVAGVFLYLLPHLPPAPPRKRRWGRS
jgi:hypothetical protein